VVEKERGQVESVRRHPHKERLSNAADHARTHHPATRLPRDARDGTSFDRPPDG
jgi:hypothetical protein